MLPQQKNGKNRISLFSSALMQSTPINICVIITQEQVSGLFGDMTNMIT